MVIVLISQVVRLGAITIWMLDNSYATRNISIANQYDKSYYGSHKVDVPNYVHGDDKLLGKKIVILDKLAFPKSTCDTMASQFLETNITILKK